MKSTLRNSFKTRIRTSSVLFSLLLTYSGVAEPLKFDVKSALGKDADAFKEIFGVEPQFRELKSQIPGKPNGNIWIFKVPELGDTNIRRKADGTTIQFVEVMFNVGLVKSWMDAFEKLNIPTKDIKEEKRENCVALKNILVNGVTYQAYFYDSNQDDPQKRATLQIEVPIVKK